MAYAKGTATNIDASRKTARTNKARVASATPIPSTGNVLRVNVAVGRKPMANKARVK